MTGRAEGTVRWEKKLLEVPVGPLLPPLLQDLQRSKSPTLDSSIVSGFQDSLAEDSIAQELRSPETEKSIDPIEKEVQVREGRRLPP